MEDENVQTVEVSGREISLAADGHLLDQRMWTETVAESLAAADGIELDSLQWWMIRFVRRHHGEYGMPPLMRVVVQAMRRETGCHDASSRTLYRLFPQGPIRTACRYAGLPRPESCI